MKKTLVGNTGFVGRNLAAAVPFDAQYAESDVSESFGADNGLVVYCGAPCAGPAEDAADAAALLAEQAMDNIRRMKPEKLVLVSTTGVYPRPSGVYEDTPIPPGEGPADGQAWHTLERQARDACPDALIIRLPDLFGEGDAQNFIYDMLMPVPRTLDEGHYADLRLKEPLVAGGYARESGEGHVLTATGKALDGLKAFFARNDYNALSETDSRAILQFYDLSNLWADVSLCLRLGLTLVNFAPAPVEAGALYHALFGEEFENRIDAPPPRSDVRTRYGREFGGHDDYMADRTEVVAGIAKFVGRALLEH